MHSSFHWRRSALPVIMLALIMPLALPLGAFAQDDDQQDVAAAPPPDSAVARIDALSGDVAIQRGDASDTVAAVTNAPILGADYVTTGDDGRAEVGFDGRAAVRLGEDVQMRFSKLDTGDRQMQLAAGTIEVRLFGDSDGQNAIDTPSISIIPRTAGAFRVAVDADGDTAVTIRSGHADIVTAQGTRGLDPGTTLLASGPAANPDVQTQPAIALDDFDSYNGQRDHIYQVAVDDSQYVNTNIQGVGDLNDNGHWVDDASYGNVWIPTTVGADWAPYRDGNWTWEDGYGWTWVAAEPWGWAPYHYGRWYFSAAYHHWAWYPPAPGRVAPAWSPALVGFVGFNIGNVSVGIGFGNIGWVPLAPHEAFHPWWGGRGTTIVNNTTIINNDTNVHYRNLMVNNAMTSVTRANFQNGNFAARVAVSSDDVRSFHPVAVRGALPIVPGQANLRFTQRGVAPALAGRPAFARTSFAGHAAIATRTPFAIQQQSVARVTHVAYHPAAAQGGAFGGSSYGRGAESATGAPSYTRGATNGAANGAPSYSRGAYGTNGNFGASGSPSYTRPANAGSTGNDPWQRFNANRNPQSTTPGANANYARPAAPSYTRPGTAGTSDRTAPGYERSANNGYERSTGSGYEHTATSGGNSYQRGYTNGGSTYTRPATTPAYSRPATPAYSRPAASNYTRPAAPAYSRSSQPAASHAYQSGYQRPQSQSPSHPQAHATRSSDDHRDH